MDRRRFTTRLMETSAGAFLLALLTPVVAFLRPQEATGGGTDTLTDPAGGPVDILNVVLGGSVLGMLGGEKVLAIRTGEQTWSVLSATCTHLGCLVHYASSEEELVCPCHGGHYDLSGKVLGGPPPAPLQTIRVRIEGDHLIRAD